MARKLTPEPPIFEKDQADMKRAALILDTVGADRWAEILRDIAVAAESAHRGPTSTAELIRWTAVVCHTARLARAVIAGATVAMDETEAAGAAHE